MIRIIICLTLILPFGGAAVAQTPAPALKASVTVTSDVVRIGDLVDNAGPVADVAIFRAPDLGTTGTVATDRIVEAIRPHQLIGIDTHGLTEVVVTHASRAITAQEISGRIAEALAGQYGFSNAHNILIGFDQEVRTLQVEPNVTGELQVVALSYVTFGLSGSVELRRQQSRFTGTATETIDALTVAHPVEHGDILKDSDLTLVRRPKAETGAVLTDINAVVGLTARHPLRPGQPLAAGDLMKPDIVMRNGTVTIVYSVPGVTLTLRGQAQANGALGDTINVLNIESKRVVQAVVSGPDRVTVGAIVTRVVDASEPQESEPQE
jgi:flagella basal body P-ring formation protein FlgA